MTNGFGSHEVQAMLIVLSCLLFAFSGGLRLFAATANLSIEGRPLGLISYPMAAAVHIYRNANVGLDPAGYAKPFEAGDRFVGMAYAEADNTAGDAGDLEVNANNIGELLLTLAAVTQKDVGRPVFATADNTYALTGHPDAFVGRISVYVSATTAWVRMGSAVERPRNGEGCIELTLTGQENFAATGAVAGTTSVGGFDLKSILGLGWTCNDAEDGGAKAEFDATAEVALASCRMRNDTLPVDKGVTWEGEVAVTGTRAAAIDINFGLGTALTTNSEADIDHADMAQLACFNLAPNSDNINFQSDNATTDVSAVDTTVDNDTGGGAFKKFKVIGRPGGTVEAWINGVRQLPTTVFALLSTANVAGFLNMEKTADAAVGTIIVRNLRVAGGMTSLAA
jgi:hypothetical protein